MTHESMSRLALAAILAAVAAPSLAVDPLPPGPGQIGTTDVLRNDVPTKRVGILAYCADIAPNAGDTGLQAGMPSAQNAGAKQAIIDTVVGGRQTWFLDGPFSRLGQLGATNIAHMLMYDDGIDRIRDIQVIDGDRVLPTATQLIQDFDVIIAYTDNKCGNPIPTGIANSAASALAGFAGARNADGTRKGLVLTGFAFSNQIGFGNALFSAGLSPIRKSAAALDPTCNRQSAREGACNVGTCVAPNFIVTNGNGFPECHAPVLGADGRPVPVDPTDPALGFQDSGNIATTYQPFTQTTDFVCEQMLASVKGPTTSSWVNAIPSASLAPGATLCFNYDGAANTTTPFLAINANRNVVAFNAFPADATDIQKFWFSCILGNAVEWLSGVRRCSVQGVPC